RLHQLGQSYLHGTVAEPYLHALAGELRERMLEEGAVSRDALWARRRAQLAKITQGLEPSIEDAVLAAGKAEVDRAVQVSEFVKAEVSFDVPLVPADLDVGYAEPFAE